jgi:hypothetical protein
MICPPILEDVAGEQDSAVGHHFPDGAADFADLVGVEAARGPVHDEDVGFVEQHLGHSDPLTVPCGRSFRR